MEAMTLIQQLRGRAAFLRDKGRIKSPGLMEQAANALEAHLAQRAQAVDVGAIRAQLLRIAADNKKSALTLGQEGLRGQCLQTAKELHDITRALSGEKAGPVGEVTFDMVRIAEHLCPTDLPHLDKLRWKARKLTELLPASPTPGKEGA